MQTGGARASAKASKAPESARFGGFRPKAAQLAGASEDTPSRAARRSWLRRREDSPRVPRFAWAGAGIASGRMDFSGL
jgi:hypothetical protein